MRNPNTGKYMKKVEKIKTKKNLPKDLTDCTKQNLLSRIQEVMTRVWAKLPDVVMSEGWGWDKYKMWISTPFLYMNYEEYDDSREI